MNDKQKEFEGLTKPLIKWLNDNYHPHVHIYIDNDHAELSEGIQCLSTKEYYRD